MIDDFQFAPSPKVIFGRQKIKELPDLIRLFGSKTLVVTGGNSFVSSESWQDLKTSFAGLKIDWHQVSIANEPSPQQIDDVVKNASSGIQCVVAIGGGSVLDAGKAISAMIRKQESVKEYLEGVGTQSHDGSKVPFIAVPTTSGTGSEATKNAVLSEVGENGFKKSLRHDNFVPNVALLDPQLTVSCPKALTAASGMDAFTQLLESYLSTNANIMTDSLAIKGLGCIRDYLERAVVEGSDLEARSGMSYASFASGLTLANAGLGTVHGMAGAIGGFFEIPHGAICGTLMSSVNRITVKKLRKEGSSNIALVKYAKVGRMFSQRAHKTDDWHIDFLLHRIEEWTAKLEMPNFSSYGMKTDDMDRVILASSNKNNPISLWDDDLLEVLESRID